MDSYPSISWENIIARMPFPLIFKARSLSKAWLARFSSLEFHEGDCKGPMVAANFQKLVIKTNNWEISGPVCIGYDHDGCHAGKPRCRPNYEKCYAYNRGSQTWQKLPSMSFIPGSSAESIQGPLVLLRADDWRTYPITTTRSSAVELYVANVLTRNCKLLPTRPPARPTLKEAEDVLFAKIVINASLKTYKVVVFVLTRHWSPLDDNNLTSVNVEHWVHMFDSSSCSWRNKKLVGIANLNDLSFPMSLTSVVYFNGALYMVGGREGRRLVAFDMEQETLRELSLDGGEQSIYGKYAEFESQDHWLFVCDADLFIVCSKETIKSEKLDRYIQVLKVDLSVETLSVVAESPPRRPHITFVTQPVAYGGCMYFWVEKESRCHSIGHMQVYNVRENCWSCISCPDGAYTGSLPSTGLHSGRILGVVSRLPMGFTQVLA